MATQQQCETALAEVAGRLAGAQDAAKSKLDERTLSCAVTDLGLLYRGRLAGGLLQDVRLAASGQPGRAPSDGSPAAQLRLTLASDDLVALAAGELDFAKAWLKGQVKLEASFADLLRLRSLL